MNYAMAFRVIRAAYGMSQRDFAARLGITPSHLSLVESGKRLPSHKLLDRLSARTDYPLDRIVRIAIAKPSKITADER